MSCTLMNTSILLEHSLTITFLFFYFLHKKKFIEDCRQNVMTPGYTAKKATFYFHTGLGQVYTIQNLFHSFMIQSIAVPE